MKQKRQSQCLVRSGIIRFVPEKWSVRATFLTNAVRALAGLAILANCCLGFASAEPPTVVLRDISKAPRVAKGELVAFDTSTSLFLPEGWKEQITSSPPAIKLTVHFHSAQWFAIEEHWRRGARNPILANYQGEGSSVYRRPFEDRELFGRLVSRTRDELTSRGAPAEIAINDIELQSFSAGYGAVREILKSPEYVKLISRVVLADSLYASLTTETLSSAQLMTTEAGTTEPRGVPDPKQMQPFYEFAQLAIAGKKQLLLAHTTIFTGSYASTVETADSLIHALGLAREVVTTGSLPAAAADAQFRLYSRCDKGGFHVWGYEGNTPQAHIAVARTIANFWNALEEEWKQMREGERKPIQEAQKKDIPGGRKGGEAAGNGSGKRGKKVQETGNARKGSKTTRRVEQR